jgi:hypothetical protein
MTDGPDNLTPREPLPADYDPHLRRVDELLAEQAQHETAIHPAPADLPERLYDLSVEPFRRGDTSAEAPLRPATAWGMPARLLAMAAVVALMITLGVVVWSLPGGPAPRPTGPPVAHADLPEMLREGEVELLEDLQSDYDNRLAQTEVVVETLAQADPWTGPTIWGRVETELITGVEGW